MIGILCQVTERNFNEPPLPNFLMSVDPNSRIFSNNLVLFLRYFINTTTCTSGLIKPTDQIVIIIIDRICTWHHFFVFNRIIITTTNVIMYFIIYITFPYFLNTDAGNDYFYSCNYLVKFSTFCIFSLSWLFSLFII